MYLREERDAALFSAYNKALAEHHFKTQSEAIDYVRTHEAPKFYISPEFCAIVLGRMMKGNPPGVSGFRRVSKFHELLKRYAEMSSRPENALMSMREICTIIVEQKAPEFYLSYRSTSEILNRQRIKCLHEMKNKWTR